MKFPENLPTVFKETITAHTQSHNLPVKEIIQHKTHAVYTKRTDLVVSTQLKPGHLALSFSGHVVIKQLQGVVASEQFTGGTKQIRREALQQHNTTQHMLRS